MTNHHDKEPPSTGGFLNSIFVIIVVAFSSLFFYPMLCLAIAVVWILAVAVLSIFPHGSDTGESHHPHPHEEHVPSDGASREQHDWKLPEQRPQAEPHRAEAPRR